MRKTMRMLVYMIGSFVFLFCSSVYADDSLSLSADSAILMEQDSGRILFEKEAHERKRIASITKIMTAILAIESNKLDEMVTVSERAEHTEGSSIYLKKGEKIKLLDLVYGLMLRSGNDAAVAIAEHVGGSVEGFVFLMNEKAARIGMTNTHFANPHGLDDHEDHYSTAYDMALLMRYAMHNETFREISGTKVYYAPDPEHDWERKWRNKNRLLTELYEYCTGGKTGYTKRAHRTLVTTASKDGENLIAVTLNASDDWNDHITMFEYGFKQYNMVGILEEGTIKAIDQKFYKNKVYLDHRIEYPLTEEEKEAVRVEYKVLKPKENWGNHPPDIVGKAIVYLGEEMIYKTPIYFDDSLINDSSSWFSLFKRLFTAYLGVNNDD
jgi:serine-type D-Ala-D-Ala carboxypeptidase (penicillin-binding protein 5/6)